MGRNWWCGTSSSENRVSLPFAQFIMWNLCLNFWIKFSFHSVCKLPVRRISTRELNPDRTLANILHFRRLFLWFFSRRLSDFCWKIISRHSNVKGRPFSPLHANVSVGPPSQTLARSWLDPRFPCLSSLSNPNLHVKTTEEKEMGEGHPTCPMNTNEKCYVSYRNTARLYMYAGILTQYTVSLSLHDSVRID
jgi:hypothetical protein